MRRRLFLLVALLLSLHGCGGGVGAEGKSEAELWVTRDRGSIVLLTAAVPAGLTVLQALEREADVDTRYGGRFVQAIEGVEGSLAAQRDWFYFVNGIEADLGAAEVTLHAGDVVWWDFRSWKDTPEGQIAVVGAFPEPFLHGWAGKRRPFEVRAPSALAEEARALGAVVGADDVDGEPNVFVLEVDESDEGATLTASRGASSGSPVTFTLAGSPNGVRAAARALAKDPAIVRYRFEARFDEEGRVVG
jgi:hypothetical protein